MHPDIIKEIARVDQKPWIKQIASRVNELLQISYSGMGNHYGDWDRRAEQAQAIVQPDKEDRRARNIKAPEKMVVPYTHGQLHTYVSFMFLQFMQNKRYFEFEATGVEDYGIRDMQELILHRDLTNSKWPSTLYQFLLDTGRWNLGVLEHTFVKETQKVKVETASAGGEIFNMPMNPGTRQTEWIDAIKFEGNRVKKISPFRFFPDTRHSLTDFQDGEFCAVEDEVSLNWLLGEQSLGNVAGIEHVREMTTETLQGVRGNRRHTNFEVDNTNRKDLGTRDGLTSQGRGMVVLTRMQLDIVPDEFEIGKKRKLGPENFPVRYLVWLTNNERIIRIEPNNYYHGRFTFSIGQSDPDIHYALAKSLVGHLQKIQEVISWLINSRNMSVRRNLEHQMIFDPEFIDHKALYNRSALVPLKKTIGRRKISEVIQQLQVSDVTSTHIQDTEYMQTLGQQVVGINDAVMGQVAKGRRSAFEHQIASIGATGRLRMMANLIHDGGLSMMAKDMTTNSRQALSRETFERILGKPSLALDPQAQAKRDEEWLRYKSNPQDLIANEDFFVFNGANPTEKAAQGQALRDLFTVLITNPGAAQAFDINPKTVFEDMIELEGGGDIRRYSIVADQQRAQQSSQRPDSQTDELLSQLINPPTNGQPGNV